MLVAHFVWQGMSSRGGNPLRLPGKCRRVELGTVIFGTADHLCIASSDWVAKVLIGADALAPWCLTRGSTPEKCSSSLNPTVLFDLLSQVKMTAEESASESVEGGREQVDAVLRSGPLFVRPPSVTRRRRRWSPSCIRVAARSRRRREFIKISS